MTWCWSWIALPSGAAKGVGEPSIISIVPAIVNAISHATGVRFNTIPITPDRMHKALKEAGKI